ncbi:MULTISPECIES: sortase-associated OmpA-like protein PdsO [Shewanella]|uniref:sortase-associated OmpA-like protein PdsO n=1 Tax=Shewanella TaxID=22 RepID=UPI001C658798|nr:MULTISPECIES: sortase-associated OmpA-like protein PdsO [Shewanella]QYJ84119.1 sortase-associated OmpA-like protein PdsO [Shewanella aegiceratis]QYJ99325.1 sortase-associated OmpA-like protein PdsO [Shewanella alkalitolerans]
MKKQIIAALISVSLFGSSMAFAAPATQATQSTNNSSADEEALIGVGSGIVLGAVVAGPVGAIIGAFTGGMIGQTVANDSEIKQQQATLAEQESRMMALKQQNEALLTVQQEYQEAKVELAQLRQHQGTRLEELALGLNVQFKTGSSTVEPHFQSQLNEVADAMAISPQLKLDLTGYADRRGDSSYNQALSEQRVAEVRSYLVSRGVDEARLDAKAYGASAPVKDEQSFENDFFDRRVTIKLLPGDTALASN